MLAYTSGEVFLRVVNTTEARKDANYIAYSMINLIDAMGPENVVEVYMDNTVNMIASGNVLFY